MLHLLVSSGIKCAYILINSLSFVMKEVSELLNTCYCNHFGVLRKVFFAPYLW